METLMAALLAAEVEPWYTSTVYLLVGFLLLGILVIGTIVAVLWWTRLPK